MYVEIPKQQRIYQILTFPRPPQINDKREEHDAHSRFTRIDEVSRQRRTCEPFFRLETSRETIEDHAEEAYEETKKEGRSGGGNSERRLAGSSASFCFLDFPLYSLRSC